jgi:hypothetical protein
MASSALTAEQKILIEDYRTAVHEMLLRDNIRVEYFAGVDQWIETTNSYYEEYSMLSATFDPKRGYVNDGNSGWVLMSQAGEPIASVAFRCDWTDNYSDYLKAGLLWGAENHPLTTPVPDLLSIETLPNIGGSIVNSGGAYVTPAFRKREFGGHRLIAYLTRLGRLHGLLRFNADWLTGQIINSRLIELEYANQVYGYTNTAIIYDGRFPTLAFDTELWLNYISREDQLYKTGQDLRQLAEKKFRTSAQHEQLVTRTQT